MSKRHEGRDRWRRLIRQQQASGLSASAFCQRTGVSPWSFYSWRRKLRDEATFTEVKIKSKREGPDLAATGSSEAIRTKKGDIAVPVVGTSAGEIELRLPGRRCVVVRPGFDRPTLIELLQVLEQNASGVAAREAGA
jgi:transposase-like protein